jgi:hypothetical protein
MPLARKTRRSVFTTKRMPKMSRNPVLAARFSSNFFQSGEAAFVGCGSRLKIVHLRNV